MVNFWAAKHLSSFLAKKERKKKKRKILYILLRKLYITLILVPLLTHCCITFSISSFWLSSISFKYISNFCMSKMLPFIWNQMLIDRNFYEISQMKIIVSLYYIKWDYIGNNSFTTYQSHPMEKTGFDAPSLSYRSLTFILE